MSNIITVDFTKSNPNVTYCPPVRPKRNRDLKKTSKTKNLPLFFLQMFEALLDRIVEIFSNTEDSLVEIHRYGIHFWRSLSVNQKINIFDRQVCMTREFSH